MGRVYIGVGSNIDPEQNIPKALRMLGKQARLASISTFYRTAPIGAAGSPDFYNGIVAVDSELAGCDLLWGLLKQIEDALGRVRTGDRNAPRQIDLDILVCGNLVAKNGPRYTLPDQQITERAFLAIPLAELEPELVLPGLNVKVSDIADGMDPGQMTPLPEFTERLRQELKLEPEES